MISESRTMSNHKRWKSTANLLLKILVTSALLYWVLRGVDLKEAIVQVKQVKGEYLLLTLILTWFGHFLCVIRWRLFLELLHIPLRTGRLILIYFIGMFSNLILPGLVGGDLVKIVLTGRSTDRHYSKALTSVYLDRAMGFLALLLIALFSSLAFPLVVQGFNLFWGFLIVTICFLAVNIILFHPQAHQWVLRLSQKTGHQGISVKTQKLVAAFSGLQKDYLRLGFTFLLSLVNQLLGLFYSFLISLALGIDAPFFYFAVFIPAITLITMIPVSINGMGLREMATALFFQTIGVSKHQGVLLGFLFSLLIIVSSLPGAIAYILHKNEVSSEELAAVEKELSAGE